jgi:uncharacterized protein
VIDPSVLNLLDQRLGFGRARRRLAKEGQLRIKTVPRLKFLHRKTWFAHPHFIATLLWFAGLYARGRRNTEAVILRKNIVHSSSLPSAFDGFKILHLSDLHVDGNEAAMRRVVALMDDCDYDICLLTGDYRGISRNCDAALRGMATLAARLKPPAMAVLGNHDPLEMVSGLEKMGIRVLLNECEPVLRGSERIFIAGIDDQHYFRTGDIAKAAAQIPRGEFAILLSHTPEVFWQAEQAGFQLMLSGHTHGGQICLPGSIPITLDAQLPRRFGAGAWRHGKMQGYTSVGSGTSIVPVRLNCPPEITIHELRRL